MAEAKGGSRHAMATRPVVYRLPHMETVLVRRDLVYRKTPNGPLTLDVYTPPDHAAGSRRGAVVLVIGYSEEGAVARLGCPFKEMESYVNWAQLFAAAGLIAVLYRNEEPATDAHAALDYVARHADELGVDASRIGVWACSGNVPVALSTLLRDAPTAVRCAVLCYGLMFDAPSSRHVAEAAAAFGFVNATVGRCVADLARVPLFVARAGKDEFPHLNDTIDAFVAGSLAENLPITLVNHAKGPHAFDVADDSATTREVIRQILEFACLNLR
jgi:hypothetical protein